MVETPFSNVTLRPSAGTVGTTEILDMSINIRERRSNDTSKTMTNIKTNTTMIIRVIMINRIIMIIIIINTMTIVIDAMIIDNILLISILITDTT